MGYKIRYPANCAREIFAPQILLSLPIHPQNKLRGILGEANKFCSHPILLESYFSGLLWWLLGKATGQVVLDKNLLSV